MAAFVLHTIFLPPETRLNLFLQSGVLQDPGLILVRPEFMLGLRGTPLLKLEGSSSTLKSLFPPSGNLVSRVCQSLVPGTYLHSIRIIMLFIRIMKLPKHCVLLLKIILAKNCWSILSLNHFYSYNQATFIISFGYFRLLPVSFLGRDRCDVHVLVGQSITSTEVVTTASPWAVLITPPATMILVRPASV